MKSVLYERYHQNRKLQKRILKDNDFTYRNLIGVLNKYINKNSEVLDIGCGTGAIDFYLANKGCVVSGLDISENAIRIAKLNSKNLRLENKTKFYVAKFPKINLEKKFNIIICSEVLEHLKDDNGALVLLRGLLKNNGVIIASSPSKNAPLYRMGMLKKFDDEVGHLRRYDENSYSQLFQNNKFHIINLFKTEGLVRNFLFTNDTAGKFIRLFRWCVSDLVTLLDNLSIRVFGESQIFIIARKK